MTDHKFVHNTPLMKVKVLDAEHFIAEPWCCVTHKIVVNCFQKCGFNLDQSSDVEVAAERSTAEAGVLFHEYVSCDDDDVTCEVQTLEQVIDEKFASDVEGRRKMMLTKLNL
jgi:hypothetical protein